MVWCGGLLCGVVWRGGLSCVFRGICVEMVGLVRRVGGIGLKYQKKSTNTVIKIKKNVRKY